MVFHHTIISSLYNRIDASHTFGTTCCLIVSFDNGHSKDKYKNKYKNLTVLSSTVNIDIGTKVEIQVKIVQGRISFSSLHSPGASSCFLHSIQPFFLVKDWIGWCSCHTSKKAESLETLSPQIFWIFRKILGWEREINTAPKPSPEVAPSKMEVAPS